MISEEQLYESNFTNIIENSPLDWLFISPPIKDSSVIELFYNGLFLLPDLHPTLLAIPNGRDRMCIDLHKKVSWFHGRSKKKLKAIMNNVIFKITRNFKTELELAASIHQQEGTWLTKELIDQLASIALSPESSRTALDGSVLDLLCFSFLDKETLSPLACIFGFGCGQVYHDYTMATPARDSRSLGTLLTLLVGQCLQNLGFGLWYWGNMVPYMEQFSRCGARLINRDQFYERWKHLRSSPPPCLALISTLNHIDPEPLSPPPHPISSSSPNTTITSTSSSISTISTETTTTTTDAAVATTTSTTPPVSFTGLSPSPTQILTVLEI